LTLEEFAIYIENLINELKNWYKTNMGAIPDFTGY